MSLGSPCVATAGSTGRRGSNPGSKLSAAQPNSSQLRRLWNAEERWVRLDRSGWGPGGRRFNSCLPDHRKALLKAAVCRLVASGQRGRAAVRARSS